MNNKPRYSLFKNARYAIEGFFHALKNEISFKIELFIAPFIIGGIYLTPFAFEQKLILFVTLVLVMIAELLNAGIENVVDLVTQDFHPLAKSAKDIGAAAVLFSVLLHLSIWGVLIFKTLSL